MWVLTRVNKDFTTRMGFQYPNQVGEIVEMSQSHSGLETGLRGLPNGQGSLYWLDDLDGPFLVVETLDEPKEISQGIVEFKRGIIRYIGDAEGAASFLHKAGLRGVVYDHCYEADAEVGNHGIAVSPHGNARGGENSNAFAVRGDATVESGIAVSPKWRAAVKRSGIAVGYRADTTFGVSVTTSGSAVSVMGDAVAADNGYASTECGVAVANRGFANTSRGVAIGSEVMVGPGGLGIIREPGYMAYGEEGAMIIFHAGHITRVFEVGKDMLPRTWYRFDEKGGPVHDR